MNSNRSLFAFTRGVPWSGLIQRLVHLGRIALKFVLLIALGGFAALGAFYSISTAEAWSWCILFFVIGLLAWSAVCICLLFWRAAHSRRPPPDDSAPPSSPDDGAPVPAPLRPFSPLILSAHAQPPKSRQA